MQFWIYTSVRICTAIINAFMNVNIIKKTYRYHMSLIIIVICLYMYVHMPTTETFMYSWNVIYFFFIRLYFICWTFVTKSLTLSRSMLWEHASWPDGLISYLGPPSSLPSKMHMKSLNRFCMCISRIFFRIMKTWINQLFVSIQTSTLVL